MGWKRDLLLVLGALFAVNCSAQVLIQGRVMDASTSEPLPYCAVKLQLAGTSTLSNGDGEFQLVSTLPYDTLTIAFMGYATRNVALGDLGSDQGIRLRPTGIELRSLEVTRNDRLYRMMAESGKRLRKSATHEGKAYFELESRTAGQPVEVMEAFYNARYDGPRVEGLDLKNGRIGIAPVNGNYFISRNTTKAMTMLDLAHPNPVFPATPFQGNAKAVRARYDLTLEGVVPGARPVYRIRFMPRVADGRSFSGTAWLDTATLQPRRVELHCPDCQQQPFIPMWKGPVLDSVQLSFTLDLVDRNDAAELSVLTLDYTLRYRSERRSNVIRTTGVLYDFDPGQRFILPLFDYDAEQDDYRKMTFLPYDSVFWATSVSLVRTEQQQRALDFFAGNGTLLGHGHDLPWSRRLFESNYAYWTADKRIGIKYSFAQEPYDGQGVVAKYGTAPDASRVNLEAQLFLAMDPTEDSLRFHSATIFDGFQSFWLIPEEAETDCYINLFFDLCEIERRRMAAALKGVKDGEQARHIHAEATQQMKRTTERYRRETALGRDRKALARWNSMVKDALHIDNMALFGLSGQ